MTVLNSYFNIIHGDDTTGQVNKPWLPYRSIAVAIHEGKKLAVPGEVVVNVIDQGANDPAQYRPADLPTEN